MGDTLYLDFQSVEISKKTGVIHVARDPLNPASLCAPVSARRLKKCSNHRRRPPPSAPPPRQLAVKPSTVPEALGISREQLVTVAAYLGTDFYKRDENTIAKGRLMYKTGAWCCRAAGPAALGGSALE